MQGDDGKGLIERRTAFEERTERYRRLGFDRLAAAHFVIGTAGQVEGPALDIGTGKGITAIALARKGVEVVSVDVDAKEQPLAAMLSEEAGLRHCIRFRCEDAASLPFEDGAFGCVATMDALHHFLDPVAVLTEMERVLRPGGTLILADFTPEGFDLLARMHQDEGGEHPVLGVSVDVAQAFFVHKGYSIVSRRSGHHQDISVLIKDFRGRR